MKTTQRMRLTDARKLYFDTARFWLARVKAADAQTVEDVCALLDWPDQRENIKWAAAFGPGQVFTSATMNAAQVLVELEMRRTRR